MRVVTLPLNAIRPNPEQHMPTPHELDPSYPVEATWAPCDLCGGVVYGPYAYCHGCERRHRHGLVHRRGGDLVWPCGDCHKLIVAEWEVALRYRELCSPEYEDMVFGAA